MANQTARPPAHAIPEEQQLGQFIPLHYHYNMLQDSDRVGAFEAAIDQLVSAGTRVLELGAGTGILSSFAARRGAHVICVERNPALANKAEELLLKNGLTQQTTVVIDDAARFIPTEPVDVVICEMLHVGMLREKQLQVIDAFKNNYRRAFGEGSKLPIFIPEASILMWQPIHQSFDFAGFWAPLPMFQAPRLADPRTTEIGSLDPYASIAYENEFPLHFHCNQRLLAAVHGEVNAVRFVTQNVLAIDVPNQRATTWPNQCLILPLREPIQVSRGQPIHIAFNYSSGAPIESLEESMKLSAVST